MHEVESAVAHAVLRWRGEDGSQLFTTWQERHGLITAIVAELAELPEGHEVRSWKHKAKSLGKQMGQQSQRIYDLRCQLAEARNLITIDRSGYRSMRDRVNTSSDRVAELELEIFQLQKQLRDAQVVRIQNSNLTSSVDNMKAAVETQRQQRTANMFGGLA